MLLILELPTRPHVQRRLCATVTAAVATAPTTPRARERRLRRAATECTLPRTRRPRRTMRVARRLRRRAGGHGDRRRRASAAGALKFKVTPSFLRGLYGLTDKDVGRGAASNNSQAVASFLKQYYSKADLKAFCAKGPAERRHEGRVSQADVPKAIFARSAPRRRSTATCRRPARGRRCGRRRLIGAARPQSPSSGCAEGTDGAPPLLRVATCDEESPSADEVQRIETSIPRTPCAPQINQQGPNAVGTAPSVVAWQRGRVNASSSPAATRHCCATCFAHRRLAEHTAAGASQQRVIAERRQLLQLLQAAAYQRSWCSDAPLGPAAPVQRSSIAAWAKRCQHNGSSV